MTSNFDRKAKDKRENTAPAISIDKNIMDIPGPTSDRITRSAIKATKEGTIPKTSFSLYISRY